MKSLDKGQFSKSRYAILFEPSATPHEAGWVGLLNQFLPTTLQWASGGCPRGILHFCLRFGASSQWYQGARQAYGSICLTFIFVFSMKQWWIDHIDHVSCWFVKPVWAHEGVHVLVTFRDEETRRPCIPGAQPHINQWITTSRAGLVAKLLALSREFTHRRCLQVQVLKSALIIYHIYIIYIIYILYIYIMWCHVTCWLPNAINLAFGDGIPLILWWFWRYLEMGYCWVYHINMFYMYISWIWLPFLRAFQGDFIKPWFSQTRWPSHLFSGRWRRNALGRVTGSTFATSGGGP